jgi:hypothetical protein
MAQIRLRIDSVEFRRAEQRVYGGRAGPAILPEGKEYTGS